jgi:transglutaminase-like putative cysteine protease
LRAYEDGRRPPAVTKMLIRAGYEICFQTDAPLVMLLLLCTHPSRRDSVESEVLKMVPDMPMDVFSDAYGNQCARVAMPAGLITLRSDCLVRDSGHPDPVNPYAPQCDAAELPVEALHFLLSSRYCEVDRLSDLAWQLFGQTSLGWPRVQAVCDWVHANVRFGYEHARPTKTAMDVYNERTGVCRDFTHLAITFCRALNIPARYATGYLGDIGVPPVDAPMDFSAWFEAYLGDRWYAFDARHNKPRIGRILMARGRDAVDAALTTSFGNAVLLKFVVWTDEVSGGG